MSEDQLTSFVPALHQIFGMRLPSEESNSFQLSPRPYFFLPIILSHRLIGPISLKCFQTLFRLKSLYAKFTGEMLLQFLKEEAKERKMFPVQRLTKLPGAGRGTRSSLILLHCPGNWQAVKPTSSPCMFLWRAYQSQQFHVMVTQRFVPARYTKNEKKRISIILI